MTNRLLTGGECPQGVLDVIEGAVGYLALSTGFTAIEYAALRILSNLFLSFVEEFGASALSHTESTGRTTVLLSDLVLALVDMGFDVRRLEELPRRRQYRGLKEPVALGSSNSRGVACAAVVGPGGTTVIPRPLSLRSDWPPTGRGMMTSSTASQLATTYSGVDPCSFPPPAPTHLYLPSLPEPHTFMRTQVRRPPPTTDPASLRRRVADQRRRVQNSLIRFLARVQPVHYLFPGDPESFMLVTPKKTPRPYLSALLTDSIDETSGSDEGELSSSSSKSAQLSSGKSSSTTKSASNGTSSNPYLWKPKFPDY